MWTMEGREVKTKNIFIAIHPSANLHSTNLFKKEGSVGEGRKENPGIFKV